MIIDTQPLEVEDFTGGITDYFIDGRPDQAEVMDNLFINPNKKPVTRWGSSIFVPQQIPLGLFRISNIDFLDDRMLTFSQRRVYETDGSTYTELVGPGSDPCFDVGDVNSVISSSEWQGHLLLANSNYASPQKVYIDDVGNFQLRNAGLPAFPAGVSIANPPGAGSTYLYTFVLKYDYKVFDVSFTDRGPTFAYGTIVTGGTITSGNGAVITLPTSLAAAENWDEANIDVEIYRTINGGTDYFLVTTVPLGTANYTDEVEDADLLTNLGLYTNQGASLSNGTPPRCKLLHVVNNVCYYADLQTGADDDEYLVRQSIPDDVDSVPESFFARAEQKVKGLSSIYDRPILLCDRYIYRIDNIIAASGAGNMDLRKIDDRAGCVSSDSIVQTHKGLFWAGAEGFYWSDGFLVKKISNHLNVTYQKITSNDTRKARIQGAYDAATERVIWTASIDDGSNEPDRFFVLDLKWRYTGGTPDDEESCFTTVSGDIYFRPTAVAINQGKIYRGDTRGYVLEHTADKFTDPKIDTTVAIGDWELMTIIHDYTSCFIDFGTKFLRKFVPRMLVSAANTTNLSLAISSSNDNNRVTGDLAPIRYRGNITWGDDLPLWGDAEARWNSQGLIETWRRFPAKNLRCNYKQIRLTNAQVQIITSELLGTATVDGVAKTATLGGSSKWLNNSVDFVISFENDDYTEEYVISQRTDTTLTFLDPNGKAPTGSYKWVVSGKPKGEVLELNGYVIHWQYLSKSHTPFSSGSLGSKP